MRMRIVSMMLAMAAMGIVLHPLVKAQDQDKTNKDDKTSTQAKAAKQTKTDKKDNTSKKDANTPSDMVDGKRVMKPMQGGTPQPQPKDAGIVPANAERIDDYHFRAKDENGVAWIYTKSPFGVIKRREDAEQLPVRVPAPDVSNWKVKDLGDSVRFEKPTPFGPSVWTKKKSDLTDSEKLALANATPAGNQPEAPKK